MSKKTSTTKKTSILKDTSLNGIIDATNQLLHPETKMEEEEKKIPGKLPDDFRTSLKQKALSETMGIPLDTVIENQIYEKEDTFTTGGEEQPKKRGRPPKSTPPTPPHVSPRKQTPPSPKPPPQQKPSTTNIEEEQYIISRKIDNINRILAEIYEDPVLRKRPLPQVKSRSGLLEDCSIKQLDEYRTKLFELIGRDTQVSILSSIYYGGIGFTETFCKIADKTHVTDSEVVRHIGGLDPGTVSIAIKKYNDSEEGKGCVDRDLRLIAAYYSELIPSHPLLNLASDTWKALAAIVNKPALYGLMFDHGGGGGPQPTNINVSSFASSFGSRKNRGSQ